MMHYSSHDTPAPPRGSLLPLDGLRAAPAEAGLSLEQLSQAFAEMLSAGDDPFEPVVAPPANDDPTRVDWPQLAAPPATSPDDACEITPRSILEAMLFVGRPDNRPLASDEAAALMRGVRPEEIGELVRDLNGQYAANRCPYTIASEGAGYRLALCDQYAGLREKFYGRIQEAQLSQTAIDVLAIVAYHQPVTADEVRKLRGSASGQILSQLVRRQLLCVEPVEGKPRGARYRTTPRFLTLFGLASLDDLPRPLDV